MIILYTRKVRNLKNSYSTIHRIQVSRVIGLTLSFLIGRGPRITRNNLSTEGKSWMIFDMSVVYYLVPIVVAEFVITYITYRKMTSHLPATRRMNGLFDKTTRWSPFATWTAIPIPFRTTHVDNLYSTTWDGPTIVDVLLGFPAYLNPRGVILSTDQLGANFPSSESVCLGEIAHVAGSSIMMHDASGRSISNEPGLKKAYPVSRMDRRKSVDDG
jgi:hypothetical protein